MKPTLFSRFGAVLLALCLAAHSSARAQQTLYASAYGVSGDTLYTLNPANGQTIATIGPLVDSGGNAYNIFTMSFQPGTGILYGFGEEPGWEGLVTIDTNTAVVTAVTWMPAFVELAFDPASGALFGVSEAGDLATVDLTTGQVTDLGSSGFNDPYSIGIAINPQEQYFTVPYYANGPLVTFNPATGAGTVVATLNGGPSADGYISSLTFDANDTLYGVVSDYDTDPATYSLVTINTTTGQITDLGTTVGNDAVAFSQSSTPSAPLVVTGAASAVTTNSATLNGFVTPGGKATAVSILWGTTPAFGNTNVLAGLAAGFTPQSISLPLPGLLPGTTYYYTVAASNILGSVSGGVQNFTTLIPGAQELYFVNGTELEILNAANGKVVGDIGPLEDAGGSPRQLSSLCFHPGTGALYGFTDENDLVTVNTNTARVTVIGFLNLSLAEIDFDPASGSLYGVDYEGNLCTVNPATADVTEVGDSGLDGVESGGFAISSLGQYFTVPYFANGPLAVYNPATGAAKEVATLSGAPFDDGYLFDLAFDANDTLYGINASGSGNVFQLVSIDTTSGQITAVGGVSAGDGLAFSLSALLSAPLVATVGAGAVTTNSATLNGLVNPEKHATAVSIVWGTTTNFGNTNVLTGLAAGSVPQSVSVALTGLLPGTKYYFTVVAVNSVGARSGTILNFTTLIPGAQVLYGVAGAELVTLNPADGQEASDIGALVDTNGTSYQVLDLAFQPSTGILYGLTESYYYAYRYLVTIDPNTALVTNLGIIYSRLDDIAFDPTSGALFGADDSQRLYTVDLTSLQAAEVGNSGLSGFIGAFAISPLGQYFAIPESASGPLATYNPATGAGTVVTYLSGAPFGDGELFDAAFDAHDTLYTLNESEDQTTSRLVTINPTTGVITDLGPVVADVGLVFGPSSTPTAPLVLTLPASFVTGNAATINGVANPNGQATTVSVLWGTTTNFGNTNLLAGLTAGFAPQNVAGALGGLLPGTEYYFTVVVASDAGSATGNILHFTTQPNPSPGFEQLLYSADGGTNADAQLYVLNPDNGHVVLDLGSLVDATGNHYAMTGLRFQPETGVLYGITSTNSPSYPASLVTIDPATAIVTEIGYFYVTNDAGLGDLAFDPASGALYGPGAFSGDLYAINLANGSATQVGYSGIPGNAGYGFAINASDQYFATPTGANGTLATYNPLNGIETVGASLSGATLNHAICALAFSQAGKLYGLNNSVAGASDLVTINTTTGQITKLGSTIRDLGGLAFSPPSSAPTVTTLAATHVTADSAALNGLVNPNGQATTVSILWGTSTNFGNTNVLPGLSAGLVPQNVSAVVTGLAPFTEYYFTVSAGSTLGTHSGKVLHFTTPPLGFQQVLYAAANGELYTLNPANGQMASDVGALVDTNGNPVGVFGLRFQPATGTLYGTSYPSGTGYLVTINPATAVVTQVGPLGGADVGDIAFDLSSGALYGSDFYDYLCTINLATGHATDLGNSGFSFIGSGGLAVNSLGQYFTIPYYANDSLATYNPATGAGTIVAPLSGGPTADASIYNLAFDASDTLYGLLTDFDDGSYHLITIDTTTGKITDLGVTPAEAGLAFSLPAPLAPFVTTVAAGGVTGDSATLNGTVNPNGLATAVTILWGTTTNFGNTNVLAGLPAGIAPQSVSDALTGLSPVTEYCFTVVATNALGAGSGAVRHFTTPPAAPSVTTLAAANVSAASATLNASVTPNGSHTTVYFLWGATAGYGNKAGPLDIGDGTTPVNAQETISGLASGTTYHYTVLATNLYGTNSGSDLTFTTGASAPLAVTLAASGVTGNSATLNGTVNPEGAAATVAFVWGTNANFGNTNVLASPATGIGPQSVSFTPAGLLPATEYSFAVAATNTAGAGAGEVRHFMTPALPPTVTTLAAANVSSTSATLNASVTPNGSHTTVFFQWGTTTSYGRQAGPLTIGNGTAPLKAAETISGLAPGTTYHYLVIATNLYGTNSGSDLTFTTPVPAPLVVTLAASGVTGNSATLNGTVNPEGAAATVTFVWGTNVNYGNTNTLAVPATGNSPQSVSFALAGLVPVTEYYFNLVATNTSGSGMGAVRHFTTPAMAPTATTLAASGITVEDATLNASVTPNGSHTAVFFQWGTTTNYGRTAGPFNIGNGTAPVLQNAAVNGLAPGTTYHYTVLATNSFGTNYGADMTFATPPANALGRRVDDKPSAGALDIFSVVTQADGTRQIGLAATPGQTYVIEAAGNPVGAAWTVISTNTADADGQFFFTDPQSANRPARYYRVRTQ